MLSCLNSCFPLMNSEWCYFPSRQLPPQSSLNFSPSSPFKKKQNKKPSLLSSIILFSCVLFSPWLFRSVFFCTFPSCILTSLLVFASQLLILPTRLLVCLLVLPFLFFLVLPVLSVFLFTLLPSSTSNYFPHFFPSVSIIIFLLSPLPHHRFFFHPHFIVLLPLWDFAETKLNSIPSSSCCSSSQSMLLMLMDFRSLYLVAGLQLLPISHWHYSLL